MSTKRYVQSLLGGKAACHEEVVLSFERGGVWVEYLGIAGYGSKEHIIWFEAETKRKLLLTLARNNCLVKVFSPGKFEEVAP